MYFYTKIRPFCCDFLQKIIRYLYRIFYYEFIAYASQGSNEGGFVFTLFNIFVLFSLAGCGSVSKQPDYERS